MCRHASDEPAMITFVGSLEGCNEYVCRLIAAIGPDCSWCTEEQFCAWMGYSPQYLERWLDEEWIQHFPHLVLAQKDTPSLFPFVLYRITEREQRIRVFSAQPKMRHWLELVDPVAAVQ